MKLTSTLIVASLSVFGIASCGGGGDGSNNSTPPPAVILATVDSANAAKVTKVATGAALETSEIGGMTDLTGLTASAPGGVSKTGPLAAATSQAQGMLRNYTFSSVPIPPQTQLCAVSGSMTISGDLADLNTFTAGDEINIDSDMCDDGSGTVIDGLLEMTIASFEGDINTGELLFGVDLVVTDFMVTESGETTTANGDIGTTIDTRTPPISEGSVFGDIFSVAGMGKTETISSFSTIYTEDASTFPINWTNNSMGTVDSSGFTGAVTYEALVTFEGSGENYPHTGQLLVTGANNATLLVRVIDDTRVEIDADYDGINGVDETIMMTWAELEQL